MSLETHPLLRRAVARLGADRRLDGPADRLQAASEPLERAPRVERALRGDGLGHALHPLLTDFPLGMWMSANFVDALGGRRGRPIAAGLMAGGLAAALPTIASGVAEWRGTSGAARRIGVAHAAINTGGFLLYAASLALRLAGRRTSAVAVGFTAGTVVTAGGYFGGHLSLVNRIGSADASLREPDAGLGGDRGAAGTA